MSCAFFAELYEQFITIDKQIKGYTRQLEQLAKNSDVCQRMMKVPGVGSLTATALIAAVNQGKEFKKGREMAAWLGLVPRQHSTGGKSKLLGISKRALANKNARILWALLSKEVEYQAVA